MLLARGVLYPQGNEDLDSSPTSWTSGNGKGILESPAIFENALREINIHPGKSLLYSHEGLRKDFSIGEKVAFIPDIARSNGFDRIKVLFFVRNPVAYSVSVWQQFVKDSGWHDTLNDCFYNSSFAKVNYTRTRDILEHLSKNDFFKLTALNYSKCTKQLFDVAIDWLEISRDRITMPEAGRINRSLTKGELALQLAMNRVLGGDAKIVARALTENLPDIPSSKMSPSLEAQQMLWEQLAPLITAANNHLPPGHEIIFDKHEPESWNSDTYSFSGEQLDVIGKVVAEEIRNLRYPSIPSARPTPTAPPSIFIRAAILFKNRIWK
jgi:hypothetical protein